MASVTVAGVPLESVAYRVSTRTGWRVNPGVRGDGIGVANADGLLVPGRKAALEPGGFVLSMWVRGRTYAVFTEAVDTVMTLFTMQDGPVQVELETDADSGITRVCQARVKAGFEIEHQSPLHAEFRVVMEIPSGAWTATEYTLVRRQAWGGIVPLDCGDPSLPPTDLQVLLRDPGNGVDFTLWDGHATLEERNRENVTLLLDAPVAAGRSLLLDLGQWSAIEVARPDPEDVTSDFFDDPPTALVDHTARLARRGPMFGRAMMPLRVGSALPPRVPQLLVDLVDDDDLPGLVPDMTIAVRPRWV